MSTVKLFGKKRAHRLMPMNTHRSSPMKLLLLIVVIAAAAGLALLRSQPDEMISHAKAGEVRSSPDSRPASLQPKSWSEEWYEIHKAITDSVVEEIQAF